MKKLTQKEIKFIKNCSQEEFDNYIDKRVMKPISNLFWENMIKRIMKK